MHIYHLLERSPLLPSGFLGCRGPLEVPDLLEQIVLLVAKLLVLRSVGLEVGQELHKLGLVLQQYVHHRLGLVGVRHENLSQRRERWFEPAS